MDECVDIVKYIFVINYFLRYTICSLNWSILFTIVFITSMRDTYYVLKPFQIFFLISTSSASISPKDILLNSTWYRLYLIFLCTVPPVVMIYVTTDLENVTVSPFNLNSIFIYYWLIQFILILHPLLYAKKLRIRKILHALEDLDFKLRFKNFDLSQKSRRNIIIWIVFLIVFHIFYHLVLIMVSEHHSGYELASMFWFKVIEVAMDVEMLCMSAFARLLCYRAEFLVSHLNDILNNKVDETDLNLLLCHRQLHYVLKKINRTWKYQVTFVVYLVTILTLRNLLTTFLHFNNVSMVSFGSILGVRYALPLVLLGVIGQRVANVFDNVHMVVVTMKDSTTITKAMVRSGAHMSAEGALRVRRLRGANGLQVDAKLPLKVLSAIGSILVFILQLRFDTTGL